MFAFRRFVLFWFPAMFPVRRKIGAGGHCLQIGEVDRQAKEFRFAQAGSTSLETSPVTDAGKLIADHDH